MKKCTFLVLFLAVLTLFSACRREEKEKVLVTKTQLLTNGTWVYDEYYINYNQPNSTLAYKRGEPDNSLQLHLNRLTFKTDGTFEDRLQTGTFNNGTWRLKENDTLLEMVIGQTTIRCNIVLLSENNLTWHDTSRALFAKMVH